MEDAEYGPQQKVEDPALAALMKQPLEQRLQWPTKLPGKYGEFVRNYLLRMSHYVLKTSPSIAYDIRRRRPRDRVGLRVGGRSLPADGRARPRLPARGLRAPRASTLRRCSRAEGRRVLTHADGRMDQRRLRWQFAPCRRAGPDRVEQLRARKGRRDRELEGRNILDLGDGVLLLEARAR
jgi:hypothetical protein